MSVPVEVTLDPRLIPLPLAAIAPGPSVGRLRVARLRFRRSLRDCRQRLRWRFLQGRPIAQQAHARHHGRIRHQQRRRYVDRRVRDELGVLDLSLRVVEPL